MEAETTDGAAVELERLLDAEAERVWEALTDEELLSEWLDDEVSLEPFEGGEVSVAGTDGEREKHGTVTRVDHERELELVWSDSDSSSVVTFTLLPVGPRTLLTVSERALLGRAAAPAPAARAAGKLAPVGVAGLAPDPWRARLRRLELVAGALVVA